MDPGHWRSLRVPVVGCHVDLWHPIASYYGDFYDDAIAAGCEHGVASSYASRECTRDRWLRFVLGVIVFDVGLFLTLWELARWLVGLSGLPTAVLEAGHGRLGAMLVRRGRR
jgi:hypothetical protein